jgi:hypothetical protein
MTSHRVVASDADDHSTARDGPVPRHNPRKGNRAMTILTMFPRALGFQTCPVCSGTGTDPRTSETCDNCDGKGRTD